MYRIGIQSNFILALFSKVSVLMCFPLDPEVTLDVWRRIKQPSDPHSRQLTLLWTPVNNAGFLRKTYDATHAAFPLTDAFVFSVFLALLPTWSSEVTWWSGRRRTQSGAGGGRVEKPRQSSPSAQDGMMSPSALSSTQAPTSLLTSPSLKGTTEVEVSIERLLDQPGGFPSLRWLLWRSDSRLCTGTPPVWKRLYGAAAAAFNLSWDNQETATCGCTVEWCIPGDKDPCALQWMKVPAGSNMLSLPAGTFWFFGFVFAVIQSQDNYFPWLWPSYGSVLQGISKLAADLHLIFMDAQKMDTSCWRSRLATYKSFVSLTALWSRRLRLLMLLLGKILSSQNLWRLQGWINLQVTPHLWPWSGIITRTMKPIRHSSLVTWLWHRKCSRTRWQVVQRQSCQCSFVLFFNKSWTL